MEITQFEIELNKNVIIYGEYEGNFDSKNAVIFSHGFGVRRNSNGMFSDISSVLKNDYIIIRFDYNLIDKKNNTNFIYSYKTQALILEAVINFVKNNLAQKELTLICHSAGCIVAGLVNSQHVSKIILLAPPIESIHANLKKHFSTRKGAVLDENNLSYLPRTDGSTSIIPADFWSEILTLKPFDLFEKLSKHSDVIVIRALEDDVLSDSYELIKNIPTIKYLELHGDHNFSNNRLELIKTLSSKLL